jgi:hypothetical protein
MTITSQYAPNEYVGNGVTTTFAYEFKVATYDWLKVYTRASDDEDYVITTDYVPTGVGVDAGGTVVFNTAPASGIQIYIARDIPVTQETDYVENDSFPASSHEEALDKLTALLQNALSDALRFDLDLSAYDAQDRRIRNVAEPAVASDAVNKEYVDSTIPADVASAAASASAAAASASAAASSATSASNSATTATTQASLATTRAAAALTSQNAAAASQTAAATSATNAATSATNAATSATNASNSATTATTQATNASNSATAAAASKTAAELAETNAELAETNAETAETNAETAAASAAASAAAAAASAANTVPSGFRNKIIGGDFSINPWQRGTSFSAIAAGAYSADRWLFSNSSAGVITVTKTADAPTAVQAGIFSQHCLHLDVTTADATLAAGDVCLISQNIEGFNSASFGFGQAGARFVTLSFWHKHTKTGINCVAIQNSANDRNYIAEYTQAVSDTWEKSVITIPVDTAGTWLYDTNVGLRVRFSLAAGTTFQGAAGAWQAGNLVASANQVNNLDSTANNFKIALVQLVAGDVELPFEVRSAGQELALCQRYLRDIPNPVGTGWVGAGGAGSVWVWPLMWAAMRATPTVAGATFTYVAANTGVVQAINESSGRFQATSTTSSASVSVAVTGGTLTAEL